MSLLPTTENIDTDDNDDDDDENDTMHSPCKPLGNSSDTADISLGSAGIEPNLRSELQNLEKNFSQGQREKLKIDEDIMNDAMAYYKDKDFDPREKLRILYKEQAADTGGGGGGEGGHSTILYSTTECNFRHLFLG